MEPAPKHKTIVRSVRGKVIAAFLLGCATIGLAITISYFSFNELMGTVDHLSTPNKKMLVLNNLFHKITQLDQKQRADAIANPGKTYNSFLRESQSILASIDSLRTMDWSSDYQLERLSTMEDILHLRDRRYIRYLKARSEFVYNEKFSHQLDSLANILALTQLPGDTSVRTTEKKVTTTTYPAEEKDEGTWLGRLFSKKKTTDVPETKITVQEEVTQKIDTLSVARQDSAIQQVGLIMKGLEADQRSQNAQMAAQELALVRANTQLISQLLGVLRDVEDEELQVMRKNNEQAAAVVRESTWRIAAVMVVFLVGGVVLLAFSLMDITRSNYYRKQLVEAKEEAETLSHVKQRFLANMSHEIRTPLQSILGYSEQLTSQQQAHNKEALEAIQRSSEHLLHIVNEVLDYSRIESGKFTLELEPFNLGAVVNDVVSSIRIQADGKALMLETDVADADDLFLHGDPFRMRQILYNLLGNAVKFTSEGFVRLTVKIIEDTGYTVKLRICVADSGLGMNQEDLQRIFEQFEQAEGVGKLYGGTGLGLTIVKKLVEAKNGTLHVDSEPGKGSSFTIELSFDRALASQVRAPQQPTTTATQFTGKVMVVDDDPLILRLCEVILTKHHIPYISYNDPTESLAVHLPRDVQLILLDIRMPVINGVDLCKEFRKQGRPDLQIVALTAHVLPTEREKLIQSGFDKVLTKPFRQSELLALIGDTLPTSGSNDAYPNLDALRQMMLGDDNLFQSIVAQFVEETRADLQHLDGLLKEMKTADVRNVIHKLAGRTGQMGMDKLSSKLRTIEEQINDGADVKDCLEKILDAKEELAQTVHALQESAV